MLRFALFALFLAAGAALAVPGATADTLGADARTQGFTIASEALGETRRVLVRTPIGHEASKPHAVVYVLDAEWNFEYVAAYLDYLADNDVYPPLIVTGVVNVNRNRDFVSREDAHFDDTGRADRFLAFVTDEWIPAVEGRHAADGHRVLVGHSFGGVFTLHALFRSPETFDAYLALGASAWIGDGVLFEEAAQATLRHLRRHHPENPHVAAFAAGVFEQAGRPGDAAEQYRRAIAIAEAEGLHPNEIHLDRLRRGLARVAPDGGS